MRAIGRHPRAGRGQNSELLLPSARGGGRRESGCFFLEGNFLLWEAGPLADHPGGRWDLALAGIVVTRDWLCARWRAMAATAVPGRRVPFRPAAAGVDWAGAGLDLAVLASSQTRWAAARSAMVGDSVTATRASRWQAVSRECPPL